MNDKIQKVLVCFFLAAFLYIVGTLLIYHLSIQGVDRAPAFNWWVPNPRQALICCGTFLGLILIILILRNISKDITASTYWEVLGEMCGPLIIIPTVASWFSDKSHHEILLGFVQHNAVFCHVYAILSITYTLYATPNKDKKLYKKGLESYELGDYYEALEWYKKAAKEGSIAAKKAIGDMYLEGKGVEKNIDKALTLYKNADKEYYAYKLSYLGDKYYRGDGVEQDYKEAMKWYRMAAEQGYADAKNKLDLCTKKEKECVNLA